MNSMNGDLLEIMVHADGARDTRLKLVRYRGKLRADVRLYVEKDGKRIPTQKGVSLPTDKLPALIDALYTMQLLAAEHDAQVQP